MHEEIMLLLDERKYEEALQRLREKIESGGKGQLKSLITTIYKSSNDKFLYEIGQNEFINISLDFIESENLDLKVFKELNPDIDIVKLLNDKISAKDKWLDIFGKLKKEANTSDKDYINELADIAKVVTDKKLSILILGESGVGKSYMARVIHKICGLPDEKFQEISCGEFSSEDRLNQKLFGWEKGSHNTATTAKKGKIELADKGTLFLDEIDRLPKETRDALITFIDTKKFQRLGSDRDTEVDVRLIFGTNKNLGELVSRGEMEQDFYYRIKQVILKIPPLRNRKNDFLQIITSEMKKINNDIGSDISIDLDAAKWLSLFPWPGNYRDLIMYLRKRMNISHSDGNLNFSLKYLNNYPPEKGSLFLEDEFEDFQNILKKYILQFYDIDKSYVDVEKEKNFLDAFLKPVLAKIYIKDMDDFPSKNNLAMKYVGIGGGDVSRSLLHRMYARYALLVKALFNKE